MLLVRLAWQQHDVQELCRVMFDALETVFKNTDQVLVRPENDQCTYNSALNACGFFMSMHRLTYVNCNSIKFRHNSSTIFTKDS